MKIIVKAIFSLFLIVAMLTSCNSFMSTPATSPPHLMETATPAATLPPSATAPPTTTPLPPTTTSSLIPVSGTPTVVALENGLTWLECVVPNGEYFHTIYDIPIITSCIDFPDWDVYDTRISGERIEGSNGSDLRLVIGPDVFLAKHDSTNGCCDYKFLKNGKVIIEISAPLVTFDPNRHLWNIGGKSVWELIADPPVIIVDGINFNEKYQWEGSYFPYEIKGKLIYIAKKNGKYHIVYDDQVIGADFDEISMAYCCAKISVVYGSEQYWFLGKREGTQFVISIQ